MTPRERYTPAQAVALQQQLKRQERVMKRARGLIRKAEEALNKANGNLQKAVDKYLEAKKELDRLGLTAETRGFPIDDQGYVVPKRGLKLVK